MLLTAWVLYAAAHEANQIIVRRISEVLAETSILNTDVETNHYFISGVQPSYGAGHVDAAGTQGGLEVIV